MGNTNRDFRQDYLSAWKKLESCEYQKSNTNFKNNFKIFFNSITEIDKNTVYFKYSMWFITDIKV